MASHADHIRAILEALHRAREPFDPQRPRRC